MVLRCFYEVEERGAGLAQPARHVVVRAGISFDLTPEVLERGHVFRVGTVHANLWMCRRPRCSPLVFDVSKR